MKKRKISIILALFIFGIIALSNTFLGIFIGKPIIHAYGYESSDRNFAGFECPEKGLKFETVKGNFEEYKQLSGNMDSKLCRTSKRNVLEFYEWWDFLTHPRWEYPYIEPSKNPNKDWRQEYKNK